VAGQGKAPVLVWAARALSRGYQWEEREEDYTKQDPEARSELRRGVCISYNRPRILRREEVPPEDAREISVSAPEVESSP